MIETEEVITGENCAEDILFWLYQVFPAKYQWDCDKSSRNLIASITEYTDKAANYHYAIDSSGEVFDMCVTPDICSRHTNTATTEQGQ